MLLAAADPTGDATLLWRAAHSFGLGSDVAEPAAQDDLLQIGSQVRFRHPLVRSAAYAAGTPEERVATHLALATATDADDPDRRVWHQAAAATGTDEALATDLEHMAGIAQERAGFAAAAAFLERSFTLTEDPNRRAHRGLAPRARTCRPAPSTGPAPCSPRPLPSPPTSPPRTSSTTFSAPRPNCSKQRSRRPRDQAARHQDSCCVPLSASDHSTSTSPGRRTSRRGGSRSWPDVAPRPEAL